MNVYVQIEGTELFRRQPSPPSSCRCGSARFEELLDSEQKHIEWICAHCGRTTSERNRGADGARR